MAESAPQPDSFLSKVLQWQAQDQAPRNDVSTETSPAPEVGTEPEPDAPTEADAEGEELADAESNAQVEGDDVIETLADLAKRMETSEEDLAKGLKVAGLNGEPVPLSEVLEHFRAPRPDTVAIERDRLRLTELEQERGQVGQFAEQLRQAAVTLHQQIQANEPNWDQLKAENPQLYFTRWIEHQQKQQQLAAAQQQYQRAAQMQQFEQERKANEFRRDEAHKLQKSRPEWSDQKVFAADLNATEQFMVRVLGYKSEDLANVADSRDWRVADMARRWHELQTQKPAAVKKAGALPKVMTPGTSSGADRGASVIAKRAETAAADKLKQTGRIEDAAELIKLRLARSQKSGAARALAQGRRT